MFPLHTLQPGRPRRVSSAPLAGPRSLRVPRPPVLRSRFSLSPSPAARGQGLCWGSSPPGGVLTSSHLSHRHVPGAECHMRALGHHLGGRRLGRWRQTVWPCLLVTPEGPRSDVGPMGWLPGCAQPPAGTGPPSSPLPSLGPWPGRRAGAVTGQARVTGCQSPCRPVFARPR